MYSTRNKRHYELPFKLFETPRLCRKHATTISNGHTLIIKKQSRTFKLRNFKGYIMTTDLRRRSSRKMCIDLIRIIDSTSETIRTTTGFLDYLFDQLDNLQRFNSEICKRKRKFPFTSHLVSLLVRYITLEHECFTVLPQHEKEAEFDTVQVRIWRILKLMLRNPNFQKRRRRKSHDKKTTNITVTLISKAISENKLDADFCASLIKSILIQLNRYNIFESMVNKPLLLAEARFDPTLKDIINCNDDLITDDSDSCTASCDDSSSSDEENNERCGYLGTERRKKFRIKSEMPMKHSNIHATPEKDISTSLFSSDMRNMERLVFDVKKENMLPNIKEEYEVCEYGAMMDCKDVLRENVPLDINNCINMCEESIKQELNSILTSKRKTEHFASALLNYTNDLDPNVKFTKGTKGIVKKKHTLNVPFKNIATECVFSSSDEDYYRDSDIVSEETYRFDYSKDSRKSKIVKANITANEQTSEINRFASNEMRTKNNAYKAKLKSDKLQSAVIIDSISLMSDDEYEMNEGNNDNKTMRAFHESKTFTSSKELKYPIVTFNDSISELSKSSNIITLKKNLNAILRNETKNEVHIKKERNEIINSNENLKPVKTEIAENNIVEDAIESDSVLLISDDEDLILESSPLFLENNLKNISTKISTTKETDDFIDKKGTTKANTTDFLIVNNLPKPDTVTGSSDSVENNINVHFIGADITSKISLINNDLLETEISKEVNDILAPQGNNIDVYTSKGIENISINNVDLNKKLTTGSYKEDVIATFATDAEIVALEVPGVSPDLIMTTLRDLGVNEPFISSNITEDDDKNYLTKITLPNTNEDDMESTYTPSYPESLMENNLINFPTIYTNFEDIDGVQLNFNILDEEYFSNNETKQQEMSEEESLLFNTKIDFESMMANVSFPPESVCSSIEQSNENSQQIVKKPVILRAPTTSKDNINIEKLTIIKNVTKDSIVPKSTFSSVLKRKRSSDNKYPAPKRSDAELSEAFDRVKELQDYNSPKSKSKKGCINSHDSRCLHQEKTGSYYEANSACRVYKIKNDNSISSSSFISTSKNVRRKIDTPIDVRKNKK